jgi:hypothetical protein
MRLSMHTAQASRRHLAAPGFTTVFSALLTISMAIEMVYLKITRSANPTLLRCLVQCRFPSSCHTRIRYCPARVTLPSFDESHSRVNYAASPCLSLPVQQGIRFSGARSDRLPALFTFSGSPLNSGLRPETHIHELEMLKSGMAKFIEYSARTSESALRRWGA